MHCNAVISDWDSTPTGYNIDPAGLVDQCQDEGPDCDLDEMSCCPPEFCTDCCGWRVGMLMVGPTYPLQIFRFVDGGFGFFVSECHATTPSNIIYPNWHPGWDEEEVAPSTCPHCLDCRKCTEMEV